MCKLETFRPEKFNKYSSLFHSFVKNTEIELLKISKTTKNVNLSFFLLLWDNDL